MIKPDLKLIQKYDQPGPRYTSYPTALSFTDQIDKEALLEDSKRETGPLSLYFHIPFCESLCWFCGCTTVITTEHERAKTYLDYLEKEVALFLPYLQSGRETVQLHFGGGTPNFLEPDLIRRVGRLIHDNFNFEPDAELSVELDPRRLTRDHIKAFAEMGVNRASFGVQDVNPVVQKAIHRIQPTEMNTRAIQWLREEGFKSVNLDLIYGLPHQTVESFGETLDEVIGYNPDRFAVFSYAHVPSIKPAQKILERAILPSAETKLEILTMLTEKLTSNGYIYVGMDHFAKESDELTQAQRNKTLQRNFQGYSTKADSEICGFGLSSVSQTSNVYRQNYKTSDLYTQSLADGILPVQRGYILTEEDRIRREIIMRLMCHLTLDFEEVSEELNIDFPSRFSHEIASLREMEKDELVEVTAENITITERGRLFIRNVAMCFDAYLQKRETRYSRTI